MWSRYRLGYCTLRTTIRTSTQRRVPIACNNEQQSKKINPRQADFYFNMSVVAAEKRLGWCLKHSNLKRFLSRDFGNGSVRSSRARSRRHVEYHRDGEAAIVQYLDVFLSLNQGNPLLEMRWSSICWPSTIFVIIEQSMRCELDASIVSAIVYIDQIGRFPSLVMIGAFPSIGKTDGNAGKFFCI
jgi:hypothetical protein